VLTTGLTKRPADHDQDNGLLEEICFTKKALLGATATTYIAHNSRQSFLVYIYHYQYPPLTQLIQDVYRSQILGHVWASFTEQFL